MAAPAGGGQADKSAHQISGDEHEGGYIADGGESSEDPESSEDEVEDIPGIIILSFFSQFRAHGYHSFMILLSFFHRPSTTGTGMQTTSLTQARSPV